MDNKITMTIKIEINSATLVAIAIIMIGLIEILS